jgi:phospholipid/cholesterol/gamma-HCH transport system substrate-binding protein
LKLARDSILGLFFFVGLGLLILSTIFLTELDLGRTRQVPVYFENALAVKNGDSVQVLGVKQGYVSKVEYRPQNPQPQRVLLTLNIDKATKIHEGYEFQIEYASLLGGRVVAVNPGDSAKPEIRIDPDRPLQGIVVKDPILSITNLINDEKSSLNSTLAAIRDTFESATKGKGILSKLLTDEEIANRVKNIVENIDTIVAGVKSGEGTLGKILRDPQLADDVAQIVKDVKKVTGDLAATDSPLGKLISDKELGTKLANVITNVEDLTNRITKGDGSLAKLINSPEAHDKLVKIFGSVQQALDKLNQGESLLARLFNDKELGDDARQVVHGVKEIIAGIQRGEGTVGRLVKDETLVRNLERLVRQFSRLVEDAREAAPISTFSSVLFGAF